MNRDFPSPLPGFIVFFLLLGACPGSEKLFRGDVQLTPCDLSINRLTIQSASAAAPQLVASETTGAVMSHRIELRFDAGLEFSAVAVPNDWQVQVSRVYQGGVPVQVATYFYTGNNPSHPGEFYDFANAWQTSFRLRDPNPSPPPESPLTTPLSVEVNAGSVVPGWGAIPASASFTLASALTSAKTQRRFSAYTRGGDPTGPIQVFNFILPGISYRIESTEDLRIWSERGTFSFPVPLNDHAIPLGGSWKTSEFFRILLTPETISP